MKKVFALALSLCLVLSMASIATAEAATFDLTACIASEPETIDPTLISSVDGSTYTLHMFEGLMKYVSTGELSGDDDSMYVANTDLGQAASYTVSEDGLTYTFTLRDDIVWSDGQPVTANDFVYSWRRITDPATASEYGYILTGVVANATEIQAGTVTPDQLGVAAPDDKTFVVTLVAQTPYFLSLCGFASLVPLRQDIIEANADWAQPGAMVSNGAFTLAEWTHDSYIKMVANPAYYDAAAIGPDSITWYLSDSETSILAAYQAGEYDFIDSVPTDQIAVLTESGDAFTISQISEYFLYLNTEVIADWRVRAAIALSIDRENIVENVTQAGQLPATGMVPSGILLSDGTNWVDTAGEPLYAGLAALYPDANLTTYFGRCELAQQLLAEAVAEGFDSSVTLDYEYNTSESHKAIAEAVQSDIANVLGLNCTLNNSEWQTYTDSLGEGNFSIARLGWSADYNDAATYVDMFVTGGSYNYGRWTNAEYDALIAQLKSLPGGAERDALMLQAETMLFSEGGFTVAPLYFYTQTYCMHAGFGNAMFTPLGYFQFQHVTQE